MYIFRPSENTIKPLGIRDIFPNGRHIYELLLLYNFTLSKSADIFINAYLLSDLLYESEYEGQMWMLYDSNKMLVGVGDAFSERYNVKLEKGEYFIRLQVRHENKDKLERLNTMEVILEQKITSPLSLDIFPSRSSAMTANSKFTAKTMTPGDIMPLFIGHLPHEKYMKGAKAGHYLSGNIIYLKSNDKKSVSTYPFKYIFSSSAAKKGNQERKESADKTTDDKKSTEANNVSKQMEEAVRDLKITWLPKAQDSSLYEELKQAYADYIPLHLAQLKVLDESKDRDEKLSDIVNLANDIISKIDVTGLLGYYGMKTVSEPDAASKRKEMDKIKAALVETYIKKGNALASIVKKQEENGPIIPGDDSDVDAEEIMRLMAQKELLKDTFQDLLKWVEVTDSKASSFVIAYYLVMKHYGRALRRLLKEGEEKTMTLEQFEKMIELFDDLSWTHCSKHFRNMKLVRYPKNYQPF
ncbi:Hypothetical predicted protein [Paramuricea clavata]|uniref:Uncharacterized protein n=1 Tax=Paramuricea clavata TaxID=317549 RepID=A0A6S7GP70_PARCT|nr:Hypothetical predicted protein [Paramuricea clavata]